MLALIEARTEMRVAHSQSLSQGKKLARHNVLCWKVFYKWSEKFH